MAQEIPMISKLLRSIITGNYSTALELVNGKDFNPNDTHLSWKAPVVSAIVNVIGETSKISNEKAFKELLLSIVQHKDFNPNMKDANGDTVLIHLARHPRFAWLVPHILSNPKADLNIENFMHRNAEAVATICGNKDFIKMVSDHNGNISRMPRKRKGIKKLLPEGNRLVLKRVEGAFYEYEKKKKASLYNLLKNFFSGKYSECLEIIKDKDFDPNEYDRWDEPVLTSLIYYSQDCGVEVDVDKFKEIVDAIIALDKFDANTLDADQNTPLMASMQFKELRWLTEKLYKVGSARIDLKNYWGDSLSKIAKESGNGEFYEHLATNTFKEMSV